MKHLQNISINEYETVNSEDLNLSSYIYAKIHWVAMKAKLKETNWGKIIKTVNTGHLGNCLLSR